MFGLGFGELLLVLAIALLLFGNRLPGIAHSMGRAITGFRKEVRGLEDDIGLESRG